MPSTRLQGGHSHQQCDVNYREIRRATVWSCTFHRRIDGRVPPAEVTRPYEKLPIPADLAIVHITLLVVTSHWSSAAERRDSQVLGLEHEWGAWSGRQLRQGRRCQRSSPTEPHHCVPFACSACPHSCSCPRRAEMGTNLPSVDLGSGRTAVAVCAGREHTCAVLVRLPSERENLY